MNVVPALFAVLVAAASIQTATVAERHDWHREEQKGCSELSHAGLAVSANLNRNVFAEP